jgi:hypothetical protein
MDIRRGAVTCGAVAQRLRVFYGASCALWQPDNAYRCNFDAPTQSFLGAGCVQAATVQCATLHLTSFAGQTAPKIAVASATDLVDLDPMEIFTKLRMLFGVVVGLFGIMHLGGAIAYVQDGAEQTRLLARLRDPALGFVAQGKHNGAWTWSFSQDPVTRELDVSSGSAVLMARVLGMPFVRLRAAIPPELLPGTLADAMGRSRGLSAGAVAANADKYAQQLQAEEHQSDEQKHANTNGCAADDEEGAQTRADAAVFTSTALMFAFLSMRCVLDEEQINAQRELTVAYFASAGISDADADGARFGALTDKFKALLASDNLRARDDWMNRARMWRFIFLANDAGYYDPLAGLAFALRAVAMRPTPVSGVQGVLTRAWQLMGAAVSLQQGVSDDARSAQLTGATSMARTAKEEDAAADVELPFQEDCPLTFSAAAILSSMPTALLATSLPGGGGGGDDGGALAARVWTTALCAASMEQMEVSWALNQPAFPGMSAVGDGISTETLLDRTAAYLHSQLDSSPAAYDDIMAAARAQAGEWSLVQQQRITALRGAQLSSSAHAALTAQRIVSGIVRAMAVSHQTLGIFFSPISDGIKRWQSFVAVISTLLALLVVNIWFHYSKSITCCEEFRTLMGCDVDYTLPCRGSHANCSELPVVFAGVLDIGVPEGYVCAAFPDTTSQRDSFVAGLISFACSLPVTLLITNTFACANAADYPANWLRWSARRQLLMGAQTWRYSGAADGGAPPGFFKLGFSTAWGVSWYYNLLQWLVVTPQAWALALDQRRRARRGEAELPPGPARDARAKELQYSLFRATGIAATYVCWAIFAWVRQRCMCTGASWLLWLAS